MYPSFDIANGAGCRAPAGRPASEDPLATRLAAPPTVNPGDDDEDEEDDDGKGGGSIDPEEDEGYDEEEDDDDEEDPLWAGTAGRAAPSATIAAPHNPS